MMIQKRTMFKDLNAYNCFFECFSNIFTNDLFQ